MQATGKKNCFKTMSDLNLIDLFCGAGGLAHGFVKEGFKVAAGIDVDPACRHPFECNNDAPFIQRDVASLNPSEVVGLFPKTGWKVLVGCAPCQPFSMYNWKNSDPKWKLLSNFSSIISYVRPDIVSMENVPNLLNFRGGSLFAGFVRSLREAGYFVSSKVVFAPDYGVPQSRKRLVLLASRHREIELEGPSRDQNRHATVRDAISSMPHIVAGDSDRTDPLHRSMRLLPRNLRRIQQSRPGGTWHDWDADLVADCHKVGTGRGYTSIYGRMCWDKPAPTITTNFYGFGNGRFGHPEQDRALSLREGAILQSFPPEYSFTAPGEAIRFNTLGRLIGNAVPVLLARAVARSVRRHIDSLDS